ncbi:hypothetical protein [Changchengzhania lutea]|uniref:hypothetical protein n=1 Tax=Changchengzhania lutea TaxID=2049305 RepID=UPI00115E43D2|nr:hypothetical protein [Changchengzhania lutea]
MSVNGQENETEKDSTEIYKKIEIYSKKNKFTKTLHKLIFKSTNKKQRIRLKKAKHQNYRLYQGKIIRHIDIVTLDPFGFSIYDTLKGPKNWLGKAGNSIHIKSKQFAIRNLLLFKENKRFDTLLVNESKRLMRSQNFIRSVAIRANKTAKTSDSIDVTVRVLDSWSIIPQGSASSSRFNLQFRERNFLGFGHQINQSFTNSLKDDRSAYDIEYAVPTIKNSYIRTSIAYKNELNGFYEKRLNIERNFFSPLTHWAGGIFLAEHFRQDSLQNVQREFDLQNFKYQTQDFWLGHALNVLDGVTDEERTTNLIAAARFTHAEYKDRPDIAYDSIRYFSNESFVLGSIGIASRQFVEDEYIFNLGIIEDVPIGFSGAVTSGFQRKNKQTRTYLGAQATIGDYFKWGYLSAKAEYGTFLNGSQREQTTYNFELNYFTNLMDLGGNWKLRQFVKPQLLIGTHRLNTLADRLTLNDRPILLGFTGNDYEPYLDSGLSGFDSDITGTKKMIISFQTQFYSPWNILGFRLNPYLNFSAGMLGDAEQKLFKSKVYPSLGIGFIIRNDYLVFSSFQLSLSFYPSIPGQGRNLFKTNAFESEDFGFHNIELGKPRTVWYH